MEVKEGRKDIITYAFMIIISLVFYFWVVPSQIYLNASAKAEPFSPDTFPKFVLGILFLASVCGEIHAIRTYLKAKKAEAQGACKAEEKSRSMTGKEIRAELIPYVIFFLDVCYGVLFKMVGFIPATIIIVPVLLFVVGCRKWSYYVIVYAFVAFLYVLFRYVLHVPIR